MKKAFLFFLVAISGLFFGCKHKDEIKKELEAPKEHNFLFKINLLFQLSRLSLMVQHLKARMLTPLS